MLISLHDSVDGRLERSVTRATDKARDVITVLKTEDVELPGLQVTSVDSVHDLMGVVCRRK